MGEFFRFKYVNNLQMFEKNIRSLYKKKKNKSKNSLTQFASDSFQQKLHKLRSAITDIKFKVEVCAHNRSLARAFQNDLNDLNISFVEI